MAHRSAWAARVWWMLRWVGFDRAAVLEVSEADIYGSGFPMNHGRGVLYLEGAWSIEGSPSEGPEPEVG